MDAMRDLLRGHDDRRKARTRAGIVTLNRTVLTLMKELSALKARGLAEEEVFEEEEEPGAAAPGEPVADPSADAAEAAADATTRAHLAEFEKAPADLQASNAESRAAR